MPLSGSPRDGGTEMRFHRPVPLTRQPTVSVVVPCYNYGRYLPTAVHSALDQDGLNVEVIVVDDRSTDDSVDVARALSVADERVRVIEHAENKRHIATYNDGLAEIKGDYVVLLSADDALPRNALTRAVALMEAHPGVGLVYGFPDNFTDEPHDVPDEVRSWSVWSGDAWLSRACRTGRNVIMSPEVVMRRSAWDEIGEYDARLPHAADMAVWLNTALRWQIGRVNGPAQALYRVHGQNMHLTTFAGMITDLRERRLVFDLLFREGRPTPPHARRLEEQAHRALARTAVKLALGHGIGADPDAPTDEFEEFAREQWPGVTRTRLWHRYLAMQGATPGPATRFSRKVRTHLGWRRWRRYGF